MGIWVSEVLNPADPYTPPAAARRPGVGRRLPPPCQAWPTHATTDAAPRGGMGCSAPWQCRCCHHACLPCKGNHFASTLLVAFVQAGAGSVVDIARVPARVVVGARVAAGASSGKYFNTAYFEFCF